MKKINFRAKISKGKMELIQKQRFEEAIRVLTRYGIPSYRIQRVLLNSIATFRRVNNIYYSSFSKTLSFKERPFLKDSLHFYETMAKLYSKQERTTFEKSFEDNSLVSNFFLNSLEVDPSLLLKNDDSLERMESDEIDYIESSIP